LGRPTGRAGSATRTGGGVGEGLVRRAGVTSGASVVATDGVRRGGKVCGRDRAEILV
jgi:hypothetical protein